ncbi:Prefoldin, subunit 4 [Atractiella rhizophila]|nr:Prefoldin, subunit 4 [Atractiella rhizophila]
MSIRMLQREDEQEEVEVTWDDQKQINRFSFLNNRLDSLKGEMKRLREEKEYMSDLLLELQLADPEDPISYKIDISFVTISTERALELTEKSGEKLDVKLEEGEEEEEKIKKEMSELKVSLYSKFGKAINLERDEEES